MPDWTLPSYPTGSDTDIETDLDYTREYANSHFPGVPYRRLTTDATELDDTHHEIDIGDRTYSDAILLYGFVTQAPANEQPTTKRGIDWDREIILNVPLVILSDNSLATLDTHFDLSSVLVSMGDQFHFHNWDFEVLNAKPGDERYHNTDIPIYWQMTARRLRPDSADVITWNMDAG